MPKVPVADTELYYEIHGEGAPLMLVSGLGGTGSYWAPQIASYSRHYKVIVHVSRAGFAGELVT